VEPTKKPVILIAGKECGGRQVLRACAERLRAREVPQALRSRCEELSRRSAASHLWSRRFVRLAAAAVLIIFTGSLLSVVTRQSDALLAAQLTAWHARYNGRHFEGRLKPIEIRVSRRMKTRLGHYTAAQTGGEPAEIAISRAHLRRHGWEEALHTLLHEMVHQWQDETSHTIDHGATFRAKAREVGIAPYARRVLATRPGRAEGSQTLGRRAARDG